MKKTTINLPESFLDKVKIVSKRTGKDRSTIIRQMLDLSVNAPEENQLLFSRSKGIRRLTESTRFITNPTDAIAYSYAGALHYLEQEKMISLATQLYSQNPLAHRLIEVISDFCVGNEISWETLDEDLSKLLDAFWTHPRNALDQTQHQKVSEFLLYGEQCYPVFVNPETGLVQLGSIHPSFIKQTVLDPDHYSFIIGVEVQNSPTKTTTYRTIYSEDPEEFLNDNALEMRSKMDGDCFYFAINALSLPMIANGIGDRAYQHRGRSEILPLMDRLGMLDDLNYLNLDRAQIGLGMIYDVTVTQGSPRDIQKVADDFGMPQGPAVRAHDEKTNIDIKSPSLGATETEKLFKMIQDEILGGMGIPSQWFGDSGNANRASAMSMELPTLKRLQARQKIVSDMFKSLVDYQVSVGIDYGLVGSDVEYSVNVPAITRKDLVIIGDALNKAVVNLEKAVENRWITNRQAGEIFREIGEGYGIELYEPEDVDMVDELLQETIEIDAVSETETQEETTPHDYIAKDNPEEELEEKSDRDLLRDLSSTTEL